MEQNVASMQRPVAAVVSIREALVAQADRAPVS